MLLGLCYFQVALVVISAASVRKKYNDDDSDQIFTDVIKNISRVNTVLHELIKNYQQLQSMYRATSLEDYSSDVEVDEVYKHVNEYNKRKPRTFNDTTDAPVSKVFHGTVMFLSEERDVTEKSDSPDAVLNSVDNKVVQKERKRHTKNKTRSHADHKHSDEIKVPDHVFYDNVHSKKTTEKTETNKTKLVPLIKNSKLSFWTTKEKTQENSNEYKTTVRSTRNVQKVLLAEVFNPDNIWTDIANKKPIKLRAQHRKMSEPKPIMRTGDQKERRKKKKIALVIVTKHKNDDDELDVWEVMSKEDQKIIENELMKTNLLRQAYGDACSKVVVKKCFLALKRTVKMSCRAMKCKGSFKTKFISLAKTGCINEFHLAGVTATPAWPKTTTVSTTTAFTFDDVFNERSFRDATRVGLEDCYPLIGKLPNSLRNETPLAFDPEVSILRDRYEKACTRVSIQNCMRACAFAYNGACANFDCGPRKRKVFRRNCLAQCKMQYKANKYREKSGKSSDSSSGSGSGSDEDY